MKKVVVLFVVFFLLFSCKKENSLTLKKQTTTTNTSNNGFVIQGSLENLYPSKVYLNKIIEKSIYPIDSSEVTNKTFQFSGIVEKPERFALTFQNYAAISIFIIENKSFSISINGKTINDPLIQGSTLNGKLNEYKEKSKKIFNQIDYLFPAFQKARLENDATTLKEIGEQMKKIELKHQQFSYQFILQNKNSFVAAMILRDQLKTSFIDTLKIKETYMALSNKVKTCPDAEIIASFLNLH